MHDMPIMIVGADTPLGSRIAERFLAEDREVRVFVTDETAADRYRGLGAKVATGDVSDDTHLSAACLNCFSVVLVTEAARDERPRAFADSDDRVLDSWVKSVGAADVPRVIWVSPEPPPPAPNREVLVAPPDEHVVETVFEYDRAEVRD